MSTPPDTLRLRAEIPGQALFVPANIAACPGLFEIPVQRRPRGAEFVYYLCQQQPSPPGHPPRLMVDYVGRAANVARRLGEHADARERDGLPPIVRVFATMHEHRVEASAVEAAMIRVCQPPYLAVRRGADVSGLPLRAQDRRVLEAWGYELH